jgi:hypothetical protein
MTVSITLLRNALTGRPPLGYLIILILLLLGSRLFLSAFTSYTSDDAFITYRYAENLASGEGFVYNPGERVQGTSSPLYTLLLSAVAVACGPSILPVASRLISLTADVISLIVLWNLLSSFSGLARFLVCVLFALYPKVVLIGISGMEASLTVMMMLVALYFYRKGNVYSAFLMFSLLFLCRVDSVVWILVCVLWAIWRARKFPLSAAVMAATIYLPWVLFSHFYFASWVPHSIVGKSVSWNHLFGAFDPLRIILGYLPFRGLQGVPLGFQVLSATLFLLPLIPGLVIALHRKDILMVFPVFFVLYNLAFSLGRVLMTDWYYLPGYLAYFVTFGYTVDWLSMKRECPLRGVFWPPILNIFVIAVLLVLLSIGAVRWTDEPAGLLLRQNRDLGVWLKEHARPDAHVFLEPIGYVGWESKLCIDDYVGLVSPSVVSYRRRHPGSDAWFMEYVRDKRPDYLVLRNWEIPRNALFQGHGDGLFHNDQDRKWFYGNYLELMWNPRAKLQDSVYLVLYKHLSYVPSVSGRVR